MKERVQKMSEIAHYLNQTDAQMLLKHMQDSLSSGQFLLTMMGHFSAGKSALINQLIGQDILPVGASETTALITYLQYGEVAHAEKIYQDQHIEACAIEDVKGIWQRGSEVVQKLQCIRVFLPSELLKNGLVIADTPGINTVLQPHIEQTAALLQSADMVCYVMRQAFTKSDQLFVEKIRSCGIPLMFVRTCWDLLSSAEENLDDTEKSIRADLAPLADDEKAVFCVSNNKSSEYNARIHSELMPYLSQTLAAKASEQLGHSVENRTRLIAKNLQSLLQERVRMIRGMLEDSERAYQEQKQELLRASDKLETAVKRKKEKAADQFGDVTREANAALTDLADSKIRAAEKYIQSMKTTDADRIGGQLAQRAESDCLLLRKDYLSYFDAFLQQNQEEILAGLSGTVRIDCDLPETILEAAEATSMTQEEINALLQLKEALKDEMDALQQKIAGGDDQKEAAQTALADLEQGAAAVDAELEALGGYVEHYRIQKGTHKHERVWGAIGTVADFATLLIPGEGWANLAVKIGGAVVKGAKAAKASVEAWKGADLVMDVVRGVHAFRQQQGIAGNSGDDTDVDSSEVFAGEQGRQKLQERLREKPATLLDYLSLSYYFKKIGKQFDQPDRVVVDQQHEDEYYQQRQAIQKRAGEQAYREAQKRIELERITDEQEIERIQLEEKQKALRRIEAELEELAQQHEQEQKAAQIKAVQNHFAEVFKTAVEDYCHSLKTELRPTLERSFMEYLETFEAQLASGIQKQQQALDALREQFEGGDHQENEAVLQQCESYLDYIGGIVS